MFTFLCDMLPIKISMCSTGILFFLIFTTVASRITFFISFSMRRDFYYFLLSSVSKLSFTYATMGLLSVLLEHASAILGISSDNGGV